MTYDNPYISVVIVSRNDDHGSRMFQRTHASVNGMISQLERHRIPSELIFVEWLPPADKPLLKEIFPWPKDRKFCSVRVLVVPPSSIINYEYSEAYSIRDLTPWNVGIRRSKGKFILSTVTDTLISDELAVFIANRKLDEKKFYRIDRCDVNRDVVNLYSLSDQLEYCKKNIIDMHTLNPLKFLFKRGIPILHDKAPGDFILMSNEKWRSLNGFPEGINCGADPILIYMAHISGARQMILKKPMRLYHIDHDSIWKRPSYISARKIFIKMKIPYKIVDVLARIGDALISSNSLLEKEYGNIQSDAVTQEIIIEMLSGKRSYVFNEDDWGLGNVDIEDFEIG